MLKKVKQIIDFINTNRKMILRLSIALICIFLVFFSEYGIIKTIDLIIEKNEINEQVNNHIIIRDSLKKRIDKLTKDSLEIERIAREHYGLVKQGEQVFISSDK